MSSTTCGRSHHTVSRRLAAVFTSFLRSINRSWTAWRARRDRRDAFANLLACDDRMLADMGVRRDEVEWAARLPLNVDAVRALHLRAEGRRRDEARGRLSFRHDARHLDRVYTQEVRALGVPR